MSDDDEVGLPQKGLNMIIKDTLPDTRIANETRDVLNQCCIEFVKSVPGNAPVNHSIHPTNLSPIIGTSHAKHSGYAHRNSARQFTTTTYKKV